MTTIRARQALTFASEARGEVAAEQMVGLIEDAAVVLSDGRVAFCGPWADRPDAAPADIEAPVVTPAWIDCHTHAIYGGSRHGDFARRNAGVGYAEILEAGGGILSTVSATRAASDQELERTLLARLQSFYGSGVSVVEVKTGYGLGLDEELRHLRIIARAAERSPVHVVATCLAAHAVPAEWRSNRQGYVSMITDELLPAVAAEGLAAQVDVFCDRGAFTVDESRAVLQRAGELGFALRVHAEELAHTGATALAAELGAASADHLEHITAADVALMAKHDVAAVLLPLVTVFLDLPDRAPARDLVQAGVRVAVSTDLNPGSAHSADLQMALSLACSLHKLTPAEALRGVTRVPAEILGVAPKFGTLVAGAHADLLAFDVDDWAEIPYYLGDAPVRRIAIRSTR